MTPKLLDAKEVADRLGVTPETVYRMARKGEIPSVRFPTLVRFDWDAVIRAGMTDEDRPK